MIVGGLVLLVPPFFLQGTLEPLPGLRPYSALELEGRDLYIREGCNVCHSQMVRPLAAETERYGPYSVAGEGAYDRPFLWGSRRTGPDLARVGGKYPDSWHWRHLEDPRALEPRSNMPRFAFLLETPLDTSLTARKLTVLRSVGHPYSDAEIENARARRAGGGGSHRRRPARRGHRAGARAGAQRGDRADRVPAEPGTRAEGRPARPAAREDAERWNGSASTSWRGSRSSP